LLKIEASTSTREAVAMTIRSISPLRQRMIEDMNARQLGPEAVLAYLSRYTHRVAISNHRLVAADQSGVTFKYKDYRIDGLGRYQTMTLPIHEFIRRFLMHVLPKSFHRIRHYGLVANGNEPPIWPAPASRSTSRPRDGIRDRGDRRRGRAARRTASMPPLWRPHARHRDLRPRMRAETPAATRATARPACHLMIPPTQLPNSRAAFDRRGSTPSLATTRSEATDQQPRAPAKPPLDRLRRPSTQPEPHPAWAQRSLGRWQLDATARSSDLESRSPRAPIAAAPSPRFRAPALLGRLPSACANTRVAARPSDKPAHSTQETAHRETLEIMLTASRQRAIRSSGWRRWVIFELFRPELDAALARSDRVAGGRPPRRSGWSASR
jgi:hypothetical protein